MTPTSRIPLIVGVCILLVVVAALGFYALSNQPSPGPDNQATTTLPVATTTPAPGITYDRASADMIKVEAPVPGAVVGKTFTVRGEARGSWYFEASFPIEVRDSSGKVLTTVVAQAQGEWMTTSFVPFVATATVPTSYIGPATIVLKKDNPSGLSAHDASATYSITIEY